jgi:hypothetical protein
MHAAFLLATKASAKASQSYRPREPVGKPCETSRSLRKTASGTNFPRGDVEPKPSSSQRRLESSNRQPCQGAAPARKRSTRSRTRRWQAARKR